MTILHRIIAFLRAMFGIPGPWRFASVEVFGHRRHFGKVREIGWLRQRFLEVEDLEREGPVERLRYGAGAIFSIQWVDDAKGSERAEMFLAERARWRIQQEERGRLEAREAALRGAVEQLVEAGTASRDRIIEAMTGQMTFAASADSLADAERALDGCIDRGRIVEDPLGSGSYRLPTEKERRDSIPF